MRKAGIRRSIAVIGALASITFANVSPASAGGPEVADLNVCSNGSFATDVWDGDWHVQVPRGKCSTIFRQISLGTPVRLELYKAGSVGRIGSPYQELIPRDVWLFTGDLANGQPFWWKS